MDPVMKLCECGCGEPAPLARASDARKGLVKGQPQRFVKGHTWKGRKRTLPKRPVLDRLFARVDKNGPNGCWVWTGALKNGYGGLQDGDGRHVSAHRATYIALVGPIPDGMEIDHLCRNRACVNPAHLEAVTRAENVRRGLSAKLTAEQVAEIRRLPLYAVTAEQIARRYGISKGHVTELRQGLHWGGV